MAISVMVVDDSQFFRQRICQLLAAYPEFRVVAEASNGKEAADKAAVVKPDIITMDYEMPVMDGITALRKIHETQDIPVIMLSSLTFEGARLTLNALEAGASDFLVKSQLGKTVSGHSILIDKLRALTALRKETRNVEEKKTSPSPVAMPASSPVQGRSSQSRPAVVLIGASTGGPVAVKKVIEGLPASLSVPIIIIQHMPGKFTRAFAERLNEQCALQVKEAQDEEVLKPGCAYVAPGGKQLLLEGGSPVRVRVVEDEDARLYKPSVDVTFGSAAKAFGGKVLAIVLTGMGDDGVKGARLLKQTGSQIWVQDANSCVVNGMPQSVRNANLADEVLDLSQLGQRLATLT